MKLNNTIKFSVVVISSLLPLCAHSDNVVNQVGVGVSNATEKVGDALQKTTESIGKVAQDVGNIALDSTITAKVKALLAAELDIPLNISVTTVNRVVYLTGVVSTTLQANRIVQIAVSVSDVKDVNASKLVVVNSESFLTDATITAKARGKVMQLVNSNLIAKGSDLHIETANGEVHIFGIVYKATDIEVIKRAIQEISGVKGVKVNIDVQVDED